LGGGYLVTITGQNFPDPTTVMVGYSSEISVTVVPEAGGTRVTFTMPAVENPGEVYLVVMNEGADTALPFIFEAAASESGTDPTNPSVNPTETPSARDEPTEMPSATDEPTETPSATDEPS
jgi:hypothetical protein